MALLIDTSNLFDAARKRYNRPIDYYRYIRYVEDRFGIQSQIVAFVTQTFDEKHIAFTDFLQTLGVKVILKRPKRVADTYVLNWNVELTIHALRLVHQSEPMILGSNDEALVPLIRELGTITDEVVILGCNIHPSFHKFAQVLEINPFMLKGPKDAATTQQLVVSSDSVCDSVQDDAEGDIQLPKT